MSLGRCVIAAMVGGMIGAAIWGAIAYFTGYEIGWIAWAIGVIVGVSVRVASGGSDGAALGVTAALIALVSIAAGKYGAVYMEVQSMFKNVNKQEVTDELVKLYIADRVVEELNAEGKTLKWPEGMTVEDAETPEDYPPEVWKDAEERWAGMTPSEQTDYRAQVRAYRKSSIEAATSSIAGMGFAESFSAWDLLWAALAVGSAFKIGSGAVSNSDD